MQSITKRHPVVAQQQFTVPPMNSLLPAFREEELAEEQAILGEGPPGALGKYLVSKKLTAKVLDRYYPPLKVFYISQGNSWVIKEIDTRVEKEPARERVIIVYHTNYRWP